MPKENYIRIRITQKEKDKFKRACQTKGLDMSKVVRKAISKAVRG